MNRKYDPPETQDQRRQIGTDRTAAPAPEAAVIRDSAPYRGIDLEFEERPPGTEFSLARKEFEFADTRSFRESSQTRCVDCVTRRGGYTDLSPYIELLRDNEPHFRTSAARTDVERILQPVAISARRKAWLKEEFDAWRDEPSHFGRRRAARGTRPTGRP